MGCGTHCRILVVNDDVRLADSVCGLLAETGYDANVAVDGREGLAVLARWPADLVVLDLIMPGMDGWSFLEHVAEWPATTRPLVLVWSVADAEGLARARQLGAADCLARPSMPDELLESIARLLN